MDSDRGQHLLLVQYEPFFFFIFSDGFVADLIELEFVEEDVFRDLDGPPQSAAALVVIEDSLEGWTMTVDEVFVPPRIPELLTPPWMAEEGVRKSIEGSKLGLESLTAHINDDSLTSGDLTIVRFRGITVDETISVGKPRWQDGLHLDVNPGCCGHCRHNIQSTEQGRLMRGAPSTRWRDGVFIFAIDKQIKASHCRHARIYQECKSII